MSSKRKAEATVSVLGTSGGAYLPFLGGDAAAPAGKKRGGASAASAGGCSSSSAVQSNGHAVRVTTATSGDGNGGGGLSVGSVDGYVSVPVPVVGPGVVAYGQNIIPVGNSLSMGGGGAPNSVQLTPVLRSGREAFPNPAVLASLVQLTGEDFGYDVQIWKKWQAESFRLNGAPQKRVPKP